MQESLTNNSRIGAINVILRSLRLGRVARGFQSKRDFSAIASGLAGKTSKNVGLRFIFERDRIFGFLPRNAN